MTSSELPPVHLLCNSLVDPLAIRTGPPALSWSDPDAIGSGPRSAYQILVASTTDALAANVGDVWDSGKCTDRGESEVLYEGRPLEPLSPFYWKVRTWSAAHLESSWSDVATFEVGIGGLDAWNGLWISWNDQALAFEPATEAGPVDAVGLGLTPAPYLRREFDVGEGLESARLYITARGLYEARVNGQRVGDAVLAPGWTDYAIRLQYQAYDVTAQLNVGANAIGVMLGDGWYCGFFGFESKRSGAHYGDHPELLAQLHLQYRNGVSESIATDASWKANWGKILHADPLMGVSNYNGLDPTGWDGPGFDDRRWYAVRTRDRDATNIVADPGPPIRVTEIIAPSSMAHIDADTVIVDFGQNLTGWLRITVDDATSHHISVRHGEMLDADGRLYVENLRTARQRDEYVTSSGSEVLEPSFTWHGFRYAEITGYPGTLAAKDVSAVVVHSDVAEAGTFACSDPIANQLHANIDWSLRGNFLSVPTDCPQRDERLGWLGDAQVFARTATYRRDVLAFFDKWLDDVIDAQRDSGAFADMAPRLGLEWCGAPAWGDAGVIVPWTLYKMYGTLRPASRCYDAMVRWMDFIAQGNPEHLRTNDLGNNYGDWLAPSRDETPRELLATAYWAYDAALMSELAGALGRLDDACAYRDLADDIARAFVTAFVDDDGRIASDSQTAYSLALSMDLLPDHLRSAAASHLVEAVRQREWHLSTGFVGVGYLLPALSAHGHTDVAYRLFEQETFPSWRYPIRHGATTTWERWDGWTPERGFQSPFMNSFNHYAFGSVGEWLYRFVAGIDQQVGTSGFSDLRVRPHPGGTLEWAGATYRTRHGTIQSRWQRDAATLSLRVHVPDNVRATVHLPSSDAGRVHDDAGRTPTSIEVFPGDLALSEAVYDVGPGEHRFEGPYDL